MNIIHCLFLYMSAEFEREKLIKQLSNKGWGNT